MAASMGPVGKWYEKAPQIKGFLLDIYGVLYNGDEPIPGSVDAIKRLSESGIPVRFCTNTSSRSKESIAGKLQSFGYNISAGEIYPPAPVVRRVLQERGLRPYLLVKQGLLEEFSDLDQTNPNCVVIADATDEFTYRNMNTAFQILMHSPILISMGQGRYYSDTNGFKLDVGPYVKALEYACDVKAEIIGKPSPMFFNTALQSMGIDPKHAVMIGDDIVNDVGGAQACGMMGVQVRTGKYRSQDEPHPTVKPDGYVDDLAQAVDLYLKHR